MSVVARQITFGPASHFCGFHDISPWSPSGRYLLTLEADEKDVLPDTHERAKIVIVDLLTSGLPVTSIAETRSWNWHLAARQQWVDECRILFNDLREGRHVAVIRDIREGAEREIDRAVWSVSKDGRWAVAPNFARLWKYYSTYGYAGVASSPSLQEACPDNDGIYLIDIDRGASDLLFSVDEIASYCLGKGKQRHRAYWLTHPTFNTDATSFCFYLRSMTSDNSLSSHFLVADREGGSVRLLAQGSVSHFDWFDQKNVVVFVRESAIERWRESRILSNVLARRFISLTRSVKRLVYGTVPIPGVGGFFWLNVETGEKAMVPRDILPGAGHNMFSPDRAWMVCDDYPDRHLEAPLFLYDLENEVRVDIGKFPTAERIAGLKEARCDLHPRWDRRGKEICIDWAAGETRQVYTVDVGDVVSR